MPWFADWHGGAFNTPPANFGYGPYSTNVSGLGANPQVPQPTATAPGAIAGNIANLGAIYSLAGGINKFQGAQAREQLAAGLPGYQGLIGQSSKNIGALLQGQVPSDVVNEILQGAAERGIVTGSPGSPNANAAYLRALGLTSLGLQQQGETELTGAIARTPQVPPMNLAPFLVTPAQQQEAAVANALYAAAPNPTAVARANLQAAQAGLGAGLGSVQPAGITMPSGGGYSGFGGMGGVYPGLTAGTATSQEPFSTQDWWSSIGWNPQTTATGTSPADEYWSSLAGEYGMSPTGEITGTSPAEDYWSSLAGEYGMSPTGDIMGGGDYGYDYYGDTSGGGAAAPVDEYGYPLGE